MKIERERVDFWAIDENRVSVVIIDTKLCKQKTSMVFGKEIFLASRVIQSWS